MKVYIATDLEGASGIWRKSQVSPDFPSDYAYGKSCLTRDVNRVVESAFDHGATEIVVWDGHGPGGLNWDQVDPRVTLERQQGFGSCCFPSLDESFDCALLIGQHAMSGTQHAFLEHTQSSVAWFELKINDEPHGEMGQFAACAGHYGVPLALVSGDRACCAEASRLFPEAVTAEVKFARIRVQCSCHPAEKVDPLLREKTAEAVAKVRSGDIPPWTLSKPIRLELMYQRVETADDFERTCSRWRRVGPRTFVRETDRQIELYTT